MGKLNASPWAVKKINSKCASAQTTVYQERLNEEAKILKGIDHPNVVGKTKHNKCTNALRSRDNKLELCVVYEKRRIKKHPEEASTTKRLYCCL